LKSLPDSLELELDGFTLKVFHGSPRDHLYEYVYPDMLEKIVFPVSDITALGHTHWQFSKPLGNMLVLNPGSIGQPRDGDPRSAITVMDTRTGSVTPLRKKYDIHQVIAAVKEHGLPDWLGERLKQGR
jgi:predicted phosphodiesterase